MIDQTQVKHVLLDLSEDSSMSARTSESLLSAVDTTPKAVVFTAIGAYIENTTGFLLSAKSAMSDQKANDSWDAEYADGLSYYNDSRDYAIDSYNSQHVMPWPQRAGWITVFTVMLLVATIGNALVTWIIFGKRI